MNQQHSQQYLRVRKFRLILPVIIVPILLVFFWLMGGGSITESPGNKKRGLNTVLPAAQVQKESANDKMAFYLAADADSLKRIEQIRMDPYLRDTSETLKSHSSAGYPMQYFADPASTEKDNKRIAEKIAEIQDRIDAGEKLTQQNMPVSPSITPPDPEMEAINQTLDKLMAIQEPRKLAPPNLNSRVVFAVGAGKRIDSSYFGRRNANKVKDLFYEESKQAGSLPNSIIAVMPVAQRIQNGSVVKLELRSAVLVNGILLPIGTHVFGVASLAGERLMVHIPSIRYQQHLVPVSLTVYDMDGLEGIYVPGSITRDVLKATADNAVQATGTAGFDLSLSTRVAAAGIGAAKSLLSRKVKQVQVTMPAGYQVLLHDNHQNN